MRTYTAGASCSILRFEDGTSLDLKCTSPEKPGLTAPNPRDGPVPKSVMEALKRYAAKRDGKPVESDATYDWPLLVMLQDTTEYVGAMLEWEHGLRPQGVVVDNYFDTSEEWRRYMEGEEGPGDGIVVFIDKDSD